jgi:pyruvate formate lyase activating enzyme
MDSELTATIFEVREFCLHDGPGIRTTVFFKGCPLRCAWCHNPEGLSPEPEMLFKSAKCHHCGNCQNGGDCPHGARVPCGRRWTVAELAQEIRVNADILRSSGGGVTFSGGEPLAQPEFVLAVTDILKTHGIHVALETSGHAPSEIYRAVVSRMDFVYQDLKHHDADTFRRLCEGDLSLILDNLDWLRKAGEPFIVRVPCIPGANDAPADRAALVRLAGTSPFMQGIEFLPYNPAAPAKYPMLGREFPKWA